MASSTFSTLPPEIHVIIARNCGNDDLINLCLTSKWMKEICLHVLYRHVNFCDRIILRKSNNPEPISTEEQAEKQQQLFHTLLSHPEYGKHVRYFKADLEIPSEDLDSVEELWCALRLLTHIKSVNIATPPNRHWTIPAEKFPTKLFQSATSVKLVGCMPYLLAKSILSAINPATLEHLCLEFVQDLVTLVRWPKGGRILPGAVGEDGRVIAAGATSGLLTMLTGRCTALRTLILRRPGKFGDYAEWHTAAEEASYLEWASFIQSVQGTLEKFVFEHRGESAWRPALDHTDKDFLVRVKDERFLRIVLPVIISENWPQLNMIELRGVRGPGGTDALAAELRAVLSENATVVISGY